MALARDDLRQRLLPIAVDARDAEDLLKAEAERNSLDSELGPLPRDRAVVQLEDGLVDGGSAAVVLVLDLLEVLSELGDLGRRRSLVSEHQPDDRRPQVVRRRRLELLLTQFAREAPLAQDRDTIAEGERLVQLVGDEDDPEALLLQPDDYAFELGKGLGGEHRGRLVEHEHARAAPERFDDLHLLLASEREVESFLVRVDLDRELLGELTETLAGSRYVETKAAGVAEHQVLEHGQLGNERRVLVDRS